MLTVIGVIATCSSEQHFRGHFLVWYMLSLVHIYCRWSEICLVLFLPLQSPWSSVTQGPFYSRFNRLWALACDTFKPLASTLLLHTSPSFATHSLSFPSKYTIFYTHHTHFITILHSNYDFFEVVLHYLHLLSHKRELLLLG